jgi:hypothetical protein
MAALRHHQRVQLVQNHIAQVLEEALRLAIGQKQRELLRCREQYVGRVELLPLPLALRRVAGTVFDTHRQPHLADRFHEVALDVDGERLERRDVERVDAGEGRAGRDPAAPGDVDERRQKAGERFAGPGRRDQKRALARLGA